MFSFISCRILRDFKNNILFVNRINSTRTFSGQNEIFSCGQLFPNIFYCSKQLSISRVGGGVRGGRVACVAQWVCCVLWRKQRCKIRRRGGRTVDHGGHAQHEAGRQQQQQHAAQTVIEKEGPDSADLSHFLYRVTTQDLT